jgi:hypothetical protein
VIVTGQSRRMPGRLQPRKDIEMSDNPGGPPKQDNLLDKLKAAAAEAKIEMKLPSAEVSREQLGQLPTQDPPRQHPKL